MKYNERLFKESGIKFYEIFGEPIESDGVLADTLHPDVLAEMKGKDDNKQEDEE